MRPNLITRLKEEWNNLDPVDPLRGLIADAIDALAEKPANQVDDINVADIPKIGCVNHDCDKCKAQQQQEPVVWVDAGNLKQLRKGDVIRVIRKGETYYSPFRYCGVLEECDYEYYRETSQFVYLEVGMATVEKIVYTRKDFATGAVYADRGDKVEVARAIEAAHGIKEQP